MKIIERLKLILAESLHIKSALNKHLGEMNIFYSRAGKEAGTCLRVACAQ